MKRILVLTVGTLEAPLRQCLERIRPTRAVFLCTAVSKATVNGLLELVPLPGFDPEADIILLGNGDELERVYATAAELLERLRREIPDADLTVDYTCGTKSMVAALAMAAVDTPGVGILLTTGERKAGEGVISGTTSSPRPVPVGTIHHHRLIVTDLPPLLARYDYAAARECVARVRLLPLPKEEALQLQRLEDRLVAFDAWDRFDHRQAADSLTEFKGKNRLLDYKLMLKRVIDSRKRLDSDAAGWSTPSMKGHGLETVEDLILNAERRVKQERYDDAVGRLYRAMELAAQLLLKQDHDILTGSLDLTLLPEAIRASFAERQERQGKPLQIGLTESYDLLAALEHPAGELWQKHRSELLDRLQIRNHSLFAHGFQSISYGMWHQLSKTICPFLEELIGLVRQHHAPMDQLPSALEAVAWGEPV